jgi:hypothetical protein
MSDEREPSLLDCRSAILPAGKNASLTVKERVNNRKKERETFMVLSWEQEDEVRQKKNI